MTQDDRPEDVAALRAFNRVYTNRLGLLNPHLDGSPFTLSEARILYELARRSAPTAAEIGRVLHLDRGQISRTLKRFSDRGLVEMRDDPAHGRQQLLSLTAAGQAAFDALEGKTHQAVGELLAELPGFRRKRLIATAKTISAIFEAEEKPTVRLRGLEPGDLGRIVERQAILYAQEYGWNQDYEALAARIVADFHQSFDPAREDAWIAEMDDQMVGSIFLVKGEKPTVAKLRLLYVEPDARGAGVGKTLVEACVRRARDLGYERLDLWTNSVLVAARGIYQKAGFELVDEAPHHSFGHDLIGQTWSLTL
ncbi:MAG: MarR family transcriptional regulator [Cereibacter sphaeroides]|uniref:MarR family transcriptional regulator n=1 Tax=Cereibacter sphaeroides TaxID=1063 RepID=A0A2W5TF94_CERSP|nr:MAG: MarR family transcriptional regulator [Cereibacter sphaeroides]